MQLTKNLRVSSFQIITGSFLGIILLGAFMLTLPVSSVDGVWTPFGDALFTSTSAVCVTGLVVQDTFRYWSLFGRLIILFLIQIGGLGFRTWEDIRANKLRLHKYRLQTKMILVTSAVLIFLPAIAFFIIEYPGLPFKERVLASLFQSVTTRTAGFNTTDYAQFTESGKLLSIILMLIGGSPGSTAGGMKTTTIAVLPYVTDGLIGNSTRADFMQTLGVRNYDVCVVAIGDDFQSSLETTALLKNLRDCAKVSVSDDGPGIPDEEKDRVFAMFYSGSRKVTDSKRSLGLGLALCRPIVRAHECEIMLDDNLPHGCVFSFTLPIKEVTLHE